MGSDKSLGTASSNRGLSGCIVLFNYRGIILTQVNYLLKTRLCSNLADVGYCYQ
jgi:hypothetical protein